jgi:hypothetical protein
MCLGLERTKSLLMVNSFISEDESKVDFLRGFPHADTRLMLFEADIYKSDEFWPAIQGCEFVFHLATPFQHQTDSQVHFSNI